MTIEQAIEMLRGEYQKALRDQFNHDPVALALYRTYRKSDPERVHHDTKPQAQEKKIAIVQILKDEGRPMSIGEIRAWLSEEYGIKASYASVQGYMTTLSMDHPISEVRRGRTLCFLIEGGLKDEGKSDQAVRHGKF